MEDKREEGVARMLSSWTYILSWNMSNAFLSLHLPLYPSVLFFLFSLSHTRARTRTHGHLRTHTHTPRLFSPSLFLILSFFFVFLIANDFTPIRYYQLNYGDPMFKLCRFLYSICQKLDLFHCQSLHVYPSSYPLSLGKSH